MQRDAKTDGRGQSGGHLESRHRGQERDSREGQGKETELDGHGGRREGNDQEWSPDSGLRVSELVSKTRSTARALTGSCVTFFSA